MYSDQPKCKCGNDAHPVYADQCEDCYVAGTHADGSLNDRMALSSYPREGGDAYRYKGLTARQVAGRRNTDS